jgi:hypothetical protein
MRSSGVAELTSFGWANPANLQPGPRASSEFVSFFMREQTMLARLLEGVPLPPPLPNPHSWSVSEGGRGPGLCSAWWHLFLGNGESPRPAAVGVRGEAGFCFLPKRGERCGRASRERGIVKALAGRGARSLVVRAMNSWSDSPA